MFDPEVGRPPGPQGDAPEDLLDPELSERRTHVVVLADRDSAADRDEVGIERPGERLAGGLERVADDHRAGELGPRADGEPGDGERVRIADPSGGQGLSWARWSSSPVVSTATRGRRAHSTSARPTEAITPASAGPISAPARSTVSPGPMSSPARRTSLPAATSTPTSTVSRPPSVSSTRTTASAPSGSIAPVEIAIASPAPSPRAAGWPALDSSTTVRRDRGRRRCRRRAPRSRPSRSCRNRGQGRR